MYLCITLLLLDKLGRLFVADGQDGKVESLSAHLFSQVHQNYNILQSNYVREDLKTSRKYFQYLKYKEGTTTRLVGGVEL